MAGARVAGGCEGRPRLACLRVGAVSEPVAQAPQAREVKLVGDVPRPCAEWVVEVCVQVQQPLRGRRQAGRRRKGDREYGEARGQVRLGTQHPAVSSRANAFRRNGGSRPALRLVTHPWAHPRALLHTLGTLVTHPWHTWKPQLVMTEKTAAVARKDALSPGAVLKASSSRPMETVTPRHPALNSTVNLIKMVTTCAYANGLADRRVKVGMGGGFFVRGEMRGSYVGVARGGN